MALLSVSGMARLGDFTLLEDLGRSAVADRFKATHATLGGPFFLKVYRRLPTWLHPELVRRGDALIGVSHPHLAPHLGHGVVEDVPFVVSPWLDGIGLPALIASLLDRRVNLTLDQCLLILADLTIAITALHRIVQDTPLAHGDVSVGHVRVGADGTIRLTGLVTPRQSEPGKPLEARFDLPGIGALLYDLVPLLRAGAGAAPMLPTQLDRVIRRALAIGPVSDHLTPVQFTERLTELFALLKLSTDRSGFVDVVQRTLRATDKQPGDGPGKPTERVTGLSDIPYPSPASTSSSIGANLNLGASPPPSLAVPGEAAPNRPGLHSTAAPVAPPWMRAASASEPPRAAAAADSFLTGSAVRSTHAPKPTPPPTPPPSPPAGPPPQPPWLQPADSTPSRAAPPVLAPAASSTAASAPPPPVGLGHGTNDLSRPVPTPTGPSAPSAKTSLATPRPATLPQLTVPIGASAKRLPRLADDDESDTTLPSFPAPNANPALHERSESEAQRPDRIATQKALPAVKALVAAGVVTADHVEQAATEQATRGGRTIEILVAHGWCSDDAVAACLAQSAGKRRIDDTALVVKDRTLLKRLPQTYALARRLLPLGLDGGTLVLAVADPFDTKMIDEVCGLLHATTVDVGVAARGALTQATMKVFADLHGAHVAGNGPRVLLCTADDGKAQQLGARLAQEGMQVEHVVDGTTARTILQGRPPDAVIATYDLPGVDGQGLLLAARNSEATAELPVFILGPRADDELMARVLDLGADDYFGEPVRPDVVVAKLRRAVGKASTRPSTPPMPAPPPSPPVPPPMAPPRRSSSSSVSMEGFELDDLPDLPAELDPGPAADVPAMPTGVMGTLRQMSLPEIVQSLEMGRKTASVDIVPQDGEKGAIAFDTGVIRFAESGSLIGNQAFFALMRHKEGFFRIHYGDAPKSINIDAPTTFLLLEAMRLMDEEGA
jgi:DNA-binding response OmpR family regulator